MAPSLPAQGQQRTGSEPGGDDGSSGRVGSDRWSYIVLVQVCSSCEMSCFLSIRLQRVWENAFKVTARHRA